MSRRREPSGPIHTRKHLARAQRERRLSRLLIGGVILFGLALIGIFVYGYLDITVFSKNRAVATVDGEKITVHEFTATVLLTQQQLESQYSQTYQLMQMFGGNAQIQQSLQQQASSIIQQLSDSSVMSQQVINQMVQDVLIRKEANKRGITVTDADVSDAIQQAFGYYANGTPTPQPTVPTSTPTETSTPNPLVLASLTPTLVPTLTATPTITLTPTSTSTPTSGPTPTVTLTPSITPTPTPYTEAAFNSNFSSYMKDMASMGVTEQDYRAYVRAHLYRTRLQDAFVAAVPKVQEEVHARHILVPTEAVAKLVLDQYNKGTPWDILARQYSQDTSNKDNGGDLGWFPKGIMVDAFTQAAFSTPVGQVSQPVQTSFGWHIIQVLGKEKRTLDSSTIQQIGQSEFSTWLKTAQDNSGAKIGSDLQQYVPAVPGLTGTATPG